MVITNSVNPDKVILTADIGEYNLLMIALMAFRDSIVDPSMCDDCVCHAEATRDHAEEVIESLMDQEKNVPALACDNDGDDDDNQENNSEAIK